MIILYLTLAIVFLSIILCITCFYHSKNMEIPGIFHWGALVLFLATCFGFNRWYEYQKVELHNSRAIVNSEMECSPLENGKFLCEKSVSNKKDTIRKNETSEWDCVTEGDKKICLKRGTKKWY